MRYVFAPFVALWLKLWIRCDWLGGEYTWGDCWRIATT